MAEARPLSILHLSTARTWRGGENQVWLLAKGLAARGQRATVAAPEGAPLLERAREAGLPVRALTIRGEADPAGIWRLARLLKELRPDILHLHDGHAVLPGQLAARLRPRGRPGVIAHRRTDFALRSPWKYYALVDKVIAVSVAVRGRLLAAGLPAAHVAVIHSGLEFPALPSRAEAVALRRELGVSDRAILVAHAAALTSEKRQADLLRALADCLGRKRCTRSAAKDSAPLDVHLAFAGSGAEEGRLRALAGELKLADRVHFLGFRRETSPLWAAADAVAYTSEAEGLCTALIEAQGAGLPALVTNAGGMREVVEPDRTGLMEAVGDVAALGAALQRLATDPALRARLGQAARERARRMFSAAAMVENTLRVYRAVLPARRGGDE